MNSKDIERGDIVRLNGGTLRMTVDKVIGEEVEVTWHNNEEDSIDRAYHASMLTLVKCNSDTAVPIDRKKAA